MTFHKKYYRKQNFIKKDKKYWTYLWTKYYIFKIKRKKQQPKKKYYMEKYYSKDDLKILLTKYK